MQREWRRLKDRGDGMVTPRSTRRRTDAATTFHSADARREAHDASEGCVRITAVAYLVHNLAGEDAARIRGGGSRSTGTVETVAARTS